MSAAVMTRSGGVATEPSGRRRAQRQRMRRRRRLAGGELAAQPGGVLARGAQIGLEPARGAAPFCLPEPGRDAADDHPGDHQHENQHEKRRAHHHGRIGRVERIERDGDDVAVGDRERHDDEAERHQDDGGDDLANHGRASLEGCTAEELPETRKRHHTGRRPSRARFAGRLTMTVASSRSIAPNSNRTYAPSDRLRRSRISLPVLKKGTYFWSTETSAPVRGLRPVRAGRFFTEKAPKPRSSTRSPRAMAAMISPRIAFTIFSTSR